MSTPHQPYLRKIRRSGVVQVRIKTQKGVQWLSTGQTSYLAAHKVCDAAFIEKLQVAACAGILMPDVISRLTCGSCADCAGLLVKWAEEKADGIAPDTLEQYRALIQQFLTETGHEKHTISAIRRHELSAWVNTKGVAVATRKARLAALRSFYGFASASGFIVGNMALLVTIQIRDLFFDEIEPEETIPLSTDEYALLMESPKLKGFYRWAVALSYWCGLRLRDVACLEWASIQEDRIVVWTKKRGKRVALSIDDPLHGAGELRQILLEILEQPVIDMRFCFPDRRDCALDTKKRAKLCVQFQRMLHDHGIKGRRFHSCRHAFALRLQAAGKTVEEIGQALGHSSAETTQIYLNHQQQA